MSTTGTISKTRIFINLCWVTIIWSNVILAKTREIHKDYLPPTFSVRVNDQLLFSRSNELFSETDKKPFSLVHFKMMEDSSFRQLPRYLITIYNQSDQPVRISNLVPYGEKSSHVYITATGPWALARAKLFRPGCGPLHVTLPDNAWELGYCSFEAGNDVSVCALARRTSWEKAQRRRYETILEPGGSVTYALWVDTFSGDWQNGLTRMFREYYLFDLENFDYTLYNRPDLNWIRDSYLMLLQFAWDHHFYDWEKQQYTIYEFLSRQWPFGWFDVYGLWPTWPRLGVDQRNQWDLYRDLPGGIAELRKLTAFAHRQGTRFFISYNPWDLSTRPEDHYQGMASLIRDLDVDGVILDTQGSSSEALQKAADSVKSGVIMYSEGMAVVKDMPGILSGRVHDAIFLQPVLNMNKLIKPDFAIFRVCQLSEGRIHREVLISFFNGYGTELNIFAPGRPEWMDTDYRLLGKTTMILRENSKTFQTLDFTPLIPTTTDSIWVNRFSSDEKTIYTILSHFPGGFKGNLFPVQHSENHHFVDLWNHREIEPVSTDLGTMIPVEIPPYPTSYRGTRNEGEALCIVQFPRLISLTYCNDSLYLRVPDGGIIKIWQGAPSYTSQPKEFQQPDLKLRLRDIAGRFEGKMVIQYFRHQQLADERIIYRKEGKPVLVSVKEKTPFNPAHLKDMVLIPAGEFVFYATSNDTFIPYPDNADSSVVRVPSFYMDKYPVTNRQYYEFVKRSRYKPADKTNYLKHWKNGKYLPEDADKPVVWVDITDAMAYARWAGKRLPTEVEWQYAAQGSDGRIYPWGNHPDSSCFNLSGVLMKSPGRSHCCSPFQVEDMVGNVWQMTGDLYDNGAHNFLIMRGGSFFIPTSSWWYVQGGTQPLHKRQMLLLVSPGFNRSATVGFRCVMDTP